MNRKNRLLDDIAEYKNLQLATHRAGRGKRRQPQTIQFLAHLNENLSRLIEQVRSGTFQPGQYRQFLIHDPKERVITAPCFTDRVLHHAIIQVCEPHFERWLIADTFACRKGLGRLVCLARAQEFAGRHTFYLKLDVRHYFDSISHAELLARLQRRFKDQPLLDLFQRIIHSFRGPLGKGLPIGSLTSQHFANFYLGWFDRFVKESLRVPGYVRYMDDMALWSDDRDQLRGALSGGVAFLADQLQLQLKPAYLNRTAHGMDFLGCRLFRRHMVLNRRSKVRYRRKLQGLERAHEKGEMDEGELQQRATALTAFTRTQGLSSWKYRQAVLESLAVSGHKASTGYSEAAAGTTTAGTAGRPTATGTSPGTGTRTTGSGLP